MTVKLSSLADDVAAQESGEWVESAIPGVRLQVRSFHSAAFQLALSAANRRLQTQFKNPAEVTEDVLAAINGNLYAQHLLLGWEGLDEKYSKELATQILTDVAHRMFREAVRTASLQVGQARLDFVEGALGNSESGSGTN